MKKIILLLLISTLLFGNNLEPLYLEIKNIKSIKKSFNKDFSN